MKHIKKFNEQMEKIFKNAHHNVHGVDYTVYDVKTKNGMSKLRANSEGILISCDRLLTWEELDRIKHEILSSAK